MVVTRAFEALARYCRHAAEDVPPGSAKIAAIATAYVRFARNYPGRYRILFERSSANTVFPPHPHDDGIATLPRALPGSPWRDEDALICNTVTKIVGNHPG